MAYSAAAHDALIRSLPLSRNHEDGGFLEGGVSKSGTDGGHIVHIEKIHPAEHGDSSAVHFTFTNDSFSVISEQLAAGTGQLVGWYHTHLFSSCRHGPFQDRYRHAPEHLPAFLAGRRPDKRHP